MVAAEVLPQPKRVFLGKGRVLTSSGDAPTAADGYRRVSGDAAAVGDGVVPLSAAHLDDADLQLTLACSHSINVPGTSDPTDDWYGAERHVDAWLAPLQRLLRAKGGRGGATGVPDWLATLLPA